MKCQHNFRQYMYDEDRQCKGKRLVPMGYFCTKCLLEIQGAEELEDLKNE